MTPDMAVVTPLNNPGGPEGDTVTVDEQLLNTEYWGGGAVSAAEAQSAVQYLDVFLLSRDREQD